MPSKKNSKKLRDIDLMACLSGIVFTVLMAACEENLVSNAEQISVTSDEEALRMHGVRDRRFKRIVTEGTFTGVDGETLRYKRYEHIGPDAAYVIFLHGFSGYLEKYEYLFTARNEYPGSGIPRDETLADLPVTFFAFDEVGHGKSSGIRDHIDDFDVYVENLKIFIDSIWNLKHHTRPIVLMGHSMGGLIIARFQETYPEYADALVAVAPMWGLQEPADVPEGMLRALADFYVSVGLGELCARADGVDALTFAAIALCHQDPTLNACFNTPSNPECSSLTMCLLQGLPNDCGMPPIDFVGLNALFQSFYTMAPGCQTMPDPVSVCSPDSPEFNGCTTDFEYCVYFESHPLAGPNPTFGWLSAGFEGIDNLMENLSGIKVPAAVLSSPIDPDVTPESHVTVCDALPDCTYIPFISDPDAGVYYLHQLLASSDKATTVGAVQAYLEAFLKNAR